MWRDFFTLTRKEQTGILGLFLILIVLLLLFFVKPTSQIEEVDKDLVKWIDEVRHHTDSIRSYKNQTVDYFFFNPDSATMEDLLQLGFSEFTSRNLINYRKAGGKVNTFEKLSGIYGMDSVHLQHIKPYLRFTKQVNKDNTTEVKKPNYRRKIDLNIADSNQLSQNGINPLIVEDVMEIRKAFYFNQRLALDELQHWTFDEWTSHKDTLLFPKKSQSILTSDFQIELNVADSAELVLLKGIGRVFAQRIIYYRMQLGGFYELNQLSEVEGISPVVLNDNRDFIIIDTSLVRKINVNKASLKRMKDHPYMDFYMARDIYELRKTKKIKLDDLLRLPSFAKADRNRIYQYFTDYP